jgi:hypothetical protein
MGLIRLDTLGSFVIDSLATFTKKERDSLPGVTNVMPEPLQTLYTKASSTSWKHTL